MSSRSRREHKPTSKFLSYYTQEFSPPHNGKQLLKKISQAPPVNFPSFAMTKKPKIQGRRKLATDEVEILFEAESFSSPEATDATNASCSEIRKSGRKHKPNSKLREFMQSSQKEGRGSLFSQKSSSGQNLSKGNASDTDSKYSERKLDFDDDESTKNCAKHISVGLVDCFEGLTKQLEKNYPHSSHEEKVMVVNENPNQSFEILSKRKKEYKKSDHSSGRGIKRSFSEDSDSFDEISPKRERLDPNVIRNLTKTKKSTRVTTVVETVNMKNNSRKKTITRNKKLKVVKNYPSKSPAVEASSDDGGVIDIASPDRSTPRKSGSKGQASNSVQSVHKANTPKQPKDIRATLRKFLIMGTKVANAISETLKNNEEDLLSKSSAFEKKCLSLVHALARQGADLEEDDMEKVLKLLDEEQEERRVYRHTFLESLRVSHLTNMALYSQMLRLLKTL